MSAPAHTTIMIHAAMQPADTVRRFFKFSFIFCISAQALSGATEAIRIANRKRNELANFTQEAYFPSNKISKRANPLDSGFSSI